MIEAPPGRPAVMGILNVTPDSFSDGGLYFGAEAAIEHGHRMWKEGADLVDVGGESTRPGAEPVSEDEELRRVLPVIRALVAKGVPISVDTSKPEVARRALEAGASMVNDVTALGSEGMAEICARFGAHVCLMHMKGDPRTMQVNPTYGDVVAEVRSYLLERARFAEAKGIPRERIWLDPGIGFGKTTAHNLALLRHLDVLVGTGFGVLVGVSRKSFLGRLLGGEDNPLPPEERLEATLGAQAWAQIAGVRAIRTHDVRQAKRVVEVLAEIRGSKAEA